MSATKPGVLRVQKIHSEGVVRMHTIRDDKYYGHLKVGAHSRTTSTAKCKKDQTPSWEDTLEVDVDDAYTQYACYSVLAPHHLSADQRIAQGLISLRNLEYDVPFEVKAAPCGEATVSCVITLLLPDHGSGPNGRASRQGKKKIEAKRKMRSTKKKLFCKESDRILNIEYDSASSSDEDSPPKSAGSGSRVTTSTASTPGSNQSDTFPAKQPST
eukprot:TRINITY_DN104461_c0_g1_i1.p1 TRINITY_DN104461_c0_g1~~TRINITY_DN104461_c0_g1_i1.p1  ORF type:complete len:214 (+),score=21.26 TRINITY_DN104461_c0_g1_i1:46-687(+)